MYIDSVIEKAEKLEMKYRLLIFAGTLVLFAVAFVFLVHVPKTEKISQISDEISGLEQKISQAKIKAKNLKKFEAERSQVDEQFAEALKLLPNQREIPSLLRSITQLGSDSNLEFRLFSPNQERAKDFYLEIPVSMEVSGPYHDVAVFFDKVGRMERIVNIFDVSMKPIKERSTILQTKCEAVTYRFKENADANAARNKKKNKKK
jgi:type IV pilus assembly protein PilO